MLACCKEMSRNVWFCVSNSYAAMLQSVCSKLWNDVFVVVVQILLDNVTNPTFDDIKLSNESINRDIVLSPDKTHLYAMTNTTV